MSTSWTNIEVLAGSPKTEPSLGLSPRNSAEVVNHGHKDISRNMSQHVPTAGNMSSTNSSLHGLRHERPSGLCTQCTSAKQTVMARWSKVKKWPTTNLSHPAYPTLLGCLFLIFFGTEFPVLAISIFFPGSTSPSLLGGTRWCPQVLTALDSL